MILDLLEWLGEFCGGRGWLGSLVALILAGITVVLFIIHTIRVFQGQCDLLGRPIQEDPFLRLELQEERQKAQEFHRQLNARERENKELIREAQMLRKELVEQTRRLEELREERDQIRQAYLEVDDRLENETLMITQMEYIADEVAHALTKPYPEFVKVRDRTYHDLLNSIQNAMQNRRDNNPKIAIFVPDPEDPERLMPHQSCGHSAELFDYRPRIHGSAVGKAWREEEPYYVENVHDGKAEFDRNKMARRTFRTLFCVPMICGKKKIGVICITGKQENAYSPSERDRFVTFASLLNPLLYSDLNQSGLLEEREEIGFGNR